MRLCSSCKRKKAVGAFAWKNRGRGIRQSSCRSCKKVHQGNWYKKHKKQHVSNVARRRRAVVAENTAYVLAFLQEHPCLDCGESDPIVLEFDHVRGVKERNISHMTRNGTSLAKLKLEIAKCEVRCANCHRRVTAKRRKMG